MLRKFKISVLLIIAGLMSSPVMAQTPEQELAKLRSEAQAEDSAFQGFSATRGAKFFQQTHGNEWSCASCHTDNPAVSGKHAKTGKVLQPLAPAVNAERFTDPKKVAKWFKRNCNDVLGRVCTSQEKGDVLAYLLTVRK